MAIKARCLKCKKGFDVVDRKDGETSPCPVCGYPLTISRRKHTKLVILAGVLILLGLIAGGIILVNNIAEQDVKANNNNATQDKKDEKSFLRMIWQQSPPTLGWGQARDLPSWVEKCIVIELSECGRGYGFPYAKVSKFSALCEEAFEKPVPPSGLPSWAVRDLVVNRAMAQNPMELTGWLRRAAHIANKGDAGAMFILGWMFNRGCGVSQSQHQAMIWYRKAADKGNTDAMDYLGWMYGSAPQDRCRAITWHRKAADKGNADAMYFLGWIYRRGAEGVPQDYSRAMGWFRKAAERGNVNAMYMLGAMCANGEGVEDNRQAASWFRKSAEKGNPGAMLILGLMYDEGWGVPQDHTEAYAWHSVASAFGNKKAEELRDIVAGDLAPSVKLAAQSQANELFKKIKKNMAK